MAWSTPSTHVAGYLITADDWNENVNNVKHLRGQDGTTVLEGDLDPNASGAQDLGASGLLWDDGWFDKLYVSNGLMTLHKGTVRTQRITWDTLTRGDWNIIPVGSANGGAGDFDQGGSGQVVLWVTDGSADFVYLGQRDEQNTAKDTSWSASRSPYGCFPFSLAANHANVRLWIGFRQTLGGAIPNPAAENYAGLHFDGSTWYAEQANGTAESQSAETAPTAGERHVLEILITSATSVQYAIDGAIVATLTGTLPTGDLDWQVLTIGDDQGGANTFRTTIGELFFQESLG